MTSSEIFWIIITIISLNYLFGLWLGYLNTLTWSDQLPEILRGIYNQERYSLQQRYEKENYRFGLLTGALIFMLTIAVIASGALGAIDNFVRNYTNSPILQGLLFFGIIGLAFDLLSIPAELYDTFVIEEKYGFNKTTLRTFLTDKIKGWMLAAILGGGLLSLIIFIYQTSGNYFWLLAWAVVTAFSLFITYFYTSLLLPLFNKLTPIEEGELKNAIEEYSTKAGFNISGIYVMDGSRRSLKGNAFFSGFGKRKKIVLFDTLISKHPTHEIVAVLAHEIGHYKHRHVLKGMIAGILQTGFLLLLCQLFIGSPVLAGALGSSQPSFHIGIIAFGILYSPFSTILGIFMNLVSRKHEYQADRFAGTTFRPDALKEALIRLSTENLSNLTPHPWYVFVHYSHPTMLQRIAALEHIPVRNA